MIFLLTSKSTKVVIMTDASSSVALIITSTRIIGTSSMAFVGLSQKGNKNQDQKWFQVHDDLRISVRKLLNFAPIERLYTVLGFSRWLR